MDLDKDETASHLKEITDTTLKFIAREGVNSFPTSIVLLNRMCCSTDDYEWYANSGLDIPKIKDGDDLHWYKKKKLYEECVKPSVKISLLEDCQLFKKYSPPQDFPVFTSKNGYYFIQGNSVSFSKSLTQTEFATLNNAVGMDEVIDICSLNTYDFFLSKKGIFRRNVDGGNIEEVHAINTFVAFDAVGNDTIVAAGSDGGLVIQYSGSLTSDPTKTEIKYDSLILPGVVDPATGVAGPGTTYTNYLPENSSCTFVVATGSKTFSLGNETTSGSFTLGNPYTASASCVEGIKSSASNFHSYSNSIMKTPDGWRINDNTVKLETVTSYCEADAYVFIGTDKGFSIYKKGKLDESIVDISSEKVKLEGTATAFEIKNDKLYVYAKSYYSTYTVDDEDNPLSFLCFNFEYEKDNAKDTVDVRKTSLNFMDIISIGDNKAIYDEKLGKMENGESKFIIAITKCDNKTVFHVFGNDDRVNAAKEMKQCCNAFDVGD